MIPYCIVAPGLHCNLMLEVIVTMLGLDQSMKVSNVIPGGNDEYLSRTQ